MISLPPIRCKFCRKPFANAGEADSLPIALVQHILDTHATEIDEGMQGRLQELIGAAAQQKRLEGNMKLMEQLASM